MSIDGRMDTNKLRYIHTMKSTAMRMNPQLHTTWVKVYKYNVKERKIDTTEDKLYKSL